MAQNHNQNPTAVEKGDEQIANTDDMLKGIRKDIPMGADILYVTISHVLGHDNEDYVFFGLSLTVILMCLTIGLYQYLIISQKNKWYYNAIYACDCKHCYEKKHISYCLQFPKHKYLGMVSAILHIISFLTFVYFHGQPFAYYGVYSQELSFILLIVWTFVNGVIHKVIQINVPKYVHINMKEIRILKNKKKELLASQYKKKIQRRYNGMVERHIKYINEKVVNDKDCFCEHDMNNVEFAEMEVDIRESDVEEGEELVELDKKLDLLAKKQKEIDTILKIVIPKKIPDDKGNDADVEEI